jgi:hypothetical protein
MCRIGEMETIRSAIFIVQKRHLETSAPSRRNVMLEANGLTVRKSAYYFLLLLPLSAAAMVAVVQMDLPREIQSSVVCAVSVFLSVGCIGVVFFQNWKIFTRQVLAALGGGLLAFCAMQLIYSVS